MDKEEQANLEKFLKLRNAVTINLLDCFEKIDKAVDAGGEMIFFGINILDDLKISSYSEIYNNFRSSHEQSYFIFSKIQNSKILS